VFSVICVVIIPFVPESPRWLVYQERVEEATKVLALTYANGNESDPIVQAQLQQIVDTIEYEKSSGQTLSVKEMFKTRPARRRVLLAISVAVFSTIAGKPRCPPTGQLVLSLTIIGNVIASYYLGPMLDNAGITDQTTQLKIVS
jgi:hypothetical protein